MTEEEMIQWIDGASYEQLLAKWRFGPIGDPFFQGRVGAHMSDTMQKLRDADPVEAVAASKRLGWK